LRWDAHPCSRTTYGEVGLRAEDEAGTDELDDGVEQEAHRGAAGRRGTVRRGSEFEVARRLGMCDLVAGKLPSTAMGEVEAGDATCRARRRRAPGASLEKRRGTVKTEGRVRRLVRQREGSGERRRQPRRAANSGSALSFGREEKEQGIAPEACELERSERSGMVRGKSSGSLLTRSRSVHCHDVASVIWRSRAASAARRKGTGIGASVHEVYRDSQGRMRCS
jgi:hypothetical protein